MIRWCVRWALVLASLVSVPACFRYVPAEFAAVPPGESVRVYLTRQGMAEVREVSNADGPFVTGTLLRLDADNLFVRVPVSTRQVGFFTERLGQELALRTSEIVQLERRQLDGVGTGLLVAGTAAAAAGIVLLIIEAVSSDNPIEPPPPDEIRIPLLSFPVR